MGKRFTMAQLDELERHFIPDLTAPSGLRWRVWNGAKSKQHSRKPGDVAGCCTNNGVWVVTFKGQKLRAAKVLLALHKRMHTPLPEHYNLEGRAVYSYLHHTEEAALVACPHKAACIDTQRWFDLQALRDNNADRVQ